jgi:CpXC protein
VRLWLVMLCRLRIDILASRGGGMRSLAGAAVEVTCGRGHPFSIEVWLVIDMEERPDLAEKVMDGSIRVFACPVCGAEVETGDPLLIYRPSQGGTERMIFANSSDDDVQDKANLLVGLFSRESGVAQDEIAIIPVPWDLLIPVLRRDIDGDLETPDAYLDLPAELGISYRQALAVLRADRGLSWVTDLGDGDLPSCEYTEDFDLSGCLHCSKPFKAKICQTTTEKPGLARRIRNGDVQSDTCPHCGGRVPLGGMLLIWRPRRQPRILLSPVPGMTTEGIRQSTLVLLDVLRRHVGARFREEWLAGARFLSREELAGTLSPAPVTDSA